MEKENPYLNMYLARGEFVRRKDENRRYKPCGGKECGTSVPHIRGERWGTLLSKGTPNLFGGF
jgi:hypothetical protein